ncbi:hypothetical protein BC833DRAFT_596783 [Globomyces pollinis-pini]|nr:hypothetical protein BC833DRAFT_596783 [Globomyces pollinis-pini]
METNQISQMKIQINFLCCSQCPRDLTLIPVILSFGLYTDIQQNSATNSLDRFGLGGIIDLLRLSDPDKIMLSSGCDLPSLGLDLSSTDPIHPYFLTPYSDSPVSNTIEPAFKLSSAYNTYKVPNVLKNLKNLTDDTLFYIFYSMPRDILQEAAAQELYKRKWKYHKEFKLWLQSEETEVSLDCEKGLFVFFDPASWTRVKKDWVLYFDQLEERVDLVSEDTK